MSQKVTLKVTKGSLPWGLAKLNSRVSACLRAKLPISCVWHGSCITILGLAKAKKGA